ncbi:apoptotic protease-activating factor 1-like isoform X2 [Ornithodoros turicata]
MLDTVESICLKKAREAILEDLEAKFVISDLQESKTLTKDDAERILSQKTEQGQARQLLDILYTKGKKGFLTFMAALEKDDRYPWIAKKLRELETTTKEESLYVYKTLHRGGVPISIKHFVHRGGLESEIREALKAVSETPYDCSWVALHGMTGCGKSIMAAEALRDYSLLKDCFPDGVFWNPIGNLRHESDILIKLNVQLDRVGLNMADIPEVAKNRLREWFSGKKAVLILDDVWERSVLSAFDVGCPMMVTTRKLSIIDEDRDSVRLIKVEDSLTLEETKSVFSMIMGIPVDELPAQVENIHETHKGLPILMATIGSALKRHAKEPESWVYYIEKSKQGIRNRKRRASGSDLYEVLQLIYEDLEDDLKNAFRDFALFLEDVDIPSQVFEILWDTDKFEVEETLERLRQKSLVRIEEDPTRPNSGIYAIHDIYHKFLRESVFRAKEELSAKSEECLESLEDLHKRFVDRILSWSKTSATPLDAYVYYYLGYHLDQASMGDKLCEIFLDLRFMEKKIRCTGTSDLISDYQRYKHHFQKSKQWDDERLDALHFLQPNVHLLSDSTADVVQLALCQPQSSSIYRKAFEVAKSNKEKPYYEWINMSNTWSLAKLRIRLHDGAVWHAEFSPNDTVVVSVGEDRAIKLWDSHSGVLLNALHSHSEPLKCCTFSSDGMLLASASCDKTVRLWSLDERIHTPTKINTRPRSASVSSLRRDSLSSLCGSIAHSAAVRCCSFSPCSSILVSADDEGEVKIHSVGGGHLATFEAATTFQNAAVISCCFTKDGKYLLLARSDNRIAVYDVREQRDAPIQLRCTLNHDDEALCDICTSPRDSRHVFSAAGSYIWRWNLERTGEPALRYNGFRTQYNLSCCAVSPDGALIAGGTTQHSILLWNALTSAIVGSFKGDTSFICSVRFSHDGLSLVSSSSDGTVVLWDVANHRHCSKVALMPILDVAFDNINPEQSPLVATFDSLGYAQVCSGLQGTTTQKKLLDENDEVTSCCFCYDRKSVVFGTKAGCVKTIPSRETAVDTKMTSVNEMEGLWFSLRRLICMRSCMHSARERIWDTEAEELLEIGQHQKEVTRIVRVKGALALSCSADGTIKLWMPAGRSCTFDGHTAGVVTCCAFDESRKLLSCSENGEIFVWNLKNPKAPSLSISGHGGHRVTACDVSKDGRLLLSGSTDKSICIWDADTGSLVTRTCFTECVRCCRFAPTLDSIRVAVGIDSGGVFVYNHNSRATQNFGHHSSWVCDVLFSANGQELASVSDTICWWSTCTGNKLQTFQLRGNVARTLFAVDDFSMFVTVDDAGMLYVLRRV